MSLENNEPFLSVYNKQNGLIYIFNAPLAEKVNDFTEHELFVPTLINIATINSNQEKLYYVIDRDKYISNKYSTYTNQIFNLKNVNIDLIPPFKHLNGKTYFNTQNMIRNDGVYLLTNANDTIKKFSFNYDRNESKIISFNSDEIQKKIISNKLLNTNLISANIESFKNKLNSERNNKEFWKCSLLLSMLFFAIEILIIKFIKI